MSPGAQSRNDTLSAAADSFVAKRHVSPLLGMGDGVKGQSRHLPVRAAQPLRPSPVPTQSMKQPCDRPHQGVSLVAAVAADGSLAASVVRSRSTMAGSAVGGRRALKRVGQRFEPVRH